MIEQSLPKVAYFCMEYALDASFKAYAGGLGILAGDYMKGAKDMDLPIIGIGIKWKQGYSDQLLDDQGKAYDSYHNYQYDFVEDTGVKVTIKIRENDVVCKIWKIDYFNNNVIYLLDTDVEENSASDRWITGQLYGWFGEERVAQEMVLGIGGVKALRALNIPVDVYHFNEGHAVLAATELIREKTEEGLSVEKAIIDTTEEVVFTTHTPIKQGNESHPLSRLEYMGAFNSLSKPQMKAIGGSPFNMTVAALRLSRNSNAVAQLHGETANEMWKDVEGKSDIIAITNAIHTPTWVDDRIINSYKNENALWNNHMELKRELIQFINERNGVQLKQDKLLIGFSRRAAPYKRSDLIFRDTKHIGPLLESGDIQIVFAGKAHPLDDTGKEIVANLHKMSQKYPNSVVFLQNYDMVIGKILTRGADVWLNNPIRPMEASGTSGMKAAMNGVLNLSTLDGWWPEACQDNINGWQFGNGKTKKDVEDIDAHDGKALVNTLLNKVLPTYYNNKTQWIKMMQNSIESTKEDFAMERMLNEYYDMLYIK